MRSTCMPSDSDIEPPKYTDLLTARRPLWPLAEVLGKFGRPRDDVLRRHHLVDGPVGQRLRGRERLTLENGNQGLGGCRSAGSAAECRHRPG